MGALSGMTGFGRSSGEAEFGGWAWELKSVNGRGLDVRVNSPSGFDRLDQAVRQSISKRLKRGNLQVSLRIDSHESGAGVAVNDVALQTLISHHQAITGDLVTPEALATLMTVRGVTEQAGGSSLADICTDDAHFAALLDGFNVALDKLEASRQDEGTALYAVLDGILGELEAGRVNATDLAKDQPRLLKERLAARMSELLAEQAPDPERLMLEAAMSAAKADVQEELDRLAVHIKSGRQHLEAGSPVGRKLDFLAQELNREVNTLCSKSVSVDLTQTGLAMKALVDQFKEQAANVE